MSHRHGELPDVERFLHHKMMNPVAAAEVEAERLQRPQPPRVQHLRLLHHVARLHVTVVVHVRADEVQAERAQHVRADDHDRRDVDHLHHRQRGRRPLDRCAHQMCNAVRCVETEKHVPRAPMHQRQRCVDLQGALDDADLLRPGLGPQHADERRHHVVANHQESRDAPRLAVGNGAFFHIGFRARHLVVIEVQMAANPRIDSARPRQPHQPHHQVVRHLLLAEVHAVDQVVFQLMGQRGEKCIEQQARPPRHVPAHVERR
ncbi:hypothetical protein D9M71_450690 [compost metagenome]